MQFWKLLLAYGLRGPCYGFVILLVPRLVDELNEPTGHYYPESKAKVNFRILELILELQNCL